MLPLQQAYEVRESILEYIRATYRFKDRNVGDAFYQFIEDPRHGMIKGPYVSLKTPFISAQKDTPIPLDIKPDFPPYQHQLEAFNRLTTKDGHQPENTLLTTGTGSGKTECFQFPVLDYCWRNRLFRGIKAIILYPMNALATDQASRLAKAIYKDPRLNGQVTVGLFIGRGKETTTLSTQMDETHVIEDPERILDNPPDILLTNFKMLDLRTDALALSTLVEQQQGRQKHLVEVSRPRRAPYLRRRTRNGRGEPHPTVEAEAPPAQRPSVLRRHLRHYGQRRRRQGFAMPVRE